jgi:hypothetical protein
LKIEKKMKQNYGFLGYKYALGRFNLWAVSNLNVFLGILVALMLLGVVVGIYVTVSGSPLLVFLAFIPVELWAWLAAWGKKYQDIVPVDWKEKVQDIRRNHDIFLPDLDEKFLAGVSDGHIHKQCLRAEGTVSVMNDMISPPRTVFTREDAIEGATDDLAKDIAGLGMHIVLLRRHSKAIWQ